MNQLLLWGCLSVVTLGSSNYLVLKQPSKTTPESVLLRLALTHFCGIGLALHFGLAELLPHNLMRANLAIPELSLYFFVFILLLFIIYWGLFKRYCGAPTSWLRVIISFLTLLPSCFVGFNFYGFYLGWQRQKDRIVQPIPWYEYPVMLGSLILLLVESYLTLFVVFGSMSCIVSGGTGCP